MFARVFVSVLALFSLSFALLLPQPAQAAYCVVSGQTLEAAIVAYASSCSAPREDCDKLPDGQWACASFNNPGPEDLGLVSPTTATETDDASVTDTEVVAEASESVKPTPTTTVTVDTDVAQDDSRCLAVGESLSKAVRKYSSACRLPRKDCDPTGLRGQYLCASFNNPTLADFDALQRASETSAEVIAAIEETRPTEEEPAETSTAQTQSTEPEVSEPEATAVSEPEPSQSTETHVASGTSTQSGADPECTAIGSNLRKAIDNYARQCDQPRVDCDPFPGGYICGSYRNPELIDEGTTSEVLAHTPGSQSEQSADVDEASTAQTSESSGSLNLPGARPPLPAGSVFERGDYIALHYDHAPDPDDAHATVAGLMIISHFGLRDSTGVVSGAYGAPVKHVYQPDSEAVMQATWGQEGSPNTWYNAHRHRAISLRQSADVWERTLRNGGRVMVAEGGQADYTADVMRELARRDSSLRLSDIWVFQHSYGPKSFNESQATQADLTYVKRHATYVKVPNGNMTNASANLNQKNAAVANRFLASPQYGEAWSAAFTYLNPFTRKFDGSDAVELLYMLGLDSRTIANWSEFAAYFLPRN